MARVAVIGAGTAGAASSAFLARAGHAVTLIERVSDPGPVGAGIVLQPTGLLVLERLGLRDRVVARGARLASLRCTTSEGRTVVDLAYERLSPALFGLGTHRGLLFEALMDAVRSSGVSVRCGIDIGAIEHAGELLVLVDGAGERHGPFDLVVIADGARSALRNALGCVARDVAYPWGALYFVAEDPDDRYHGELRQVVEGTGRMLGLLPTGLGPGAAPGPSKVSLFWSVRCDDVDAVRRAGIDALRREILRYDPGASAVVAQIADVDQLLVARYRDVVLRRQHAGRLVCIGDAAHSMSPQLGQGANLALFDAMVLAESLRDDDVPRALALYTRRRRRHLAFYQRMTRWLTPFFQSDRRWLAPLRDIGMSLACRVPPIRMQMIRTMCGIKRGLLRRSMPLRELLGPR